MLKHLAYLLLSAAGLLASCQQSTQTESTLRGPAAVAHPAAGAHTEAAARIVVGAYISGQPNASLYLPDSARVNDNGASWQVLVPRTDWARRMPNRVRFEVDKATGAVSTAPVK
jgi:hypothetical protein